MDPIGDTGWVEGRRLIEVLLDSDARWDERDDAAMDLANSDEHEALLALMQVGGDTSADVTLLETVGEAIAEILNRSAEPVPATVQRLAPAAFRAFRASFGRGDLEED